MVKNIFVLLGIGFIIAFFFTDPAAKTDDGYSLRYFFLTMGVWFTGLPFLITGYVRYRRKRRMKRKKYFMKNGINATATVIDAERTGTMINNVPQYRFYLKVTTPADEEYNITVKKVVGYDIFRLKPGVEIPMFIDPKDKGEYFICWEEATRSDNKDMIF